MKFFQISCDDTLKYFESDKNGLSTAEAEKRIETYGFNELKTEKKKSLLSRFAQQFNDFMIILLIIAAVVSAIMTFVQREYGEIVNAVVILLVVVLNAVIGVIQEYKAENALDELKKLSAPKAKALRDGKIVTIDAKNLVPGDVIILEAGDFVPADARIIECNSLKTEETALTGESVPVDKSIDILSGDNLPVGDMTNMVFATTLVTYGRAKAVVCATGMYTQVGKIASMLTTQKEEKTPLQIKIAEIGKFLGIIAIVICALIFVVGIFEKKGIMEMFLTAVSLAVAAVPEGLLATVTIVLAVGVSKLAKNNAIIKKLPSVETLGSASVICSDKTGTLTQNKMTVTKCFDMESIKEMKDYNENIKNLMKFACLCNDASLTRQGKKIVEIGDPTETAMVRALFDMGYDKSALERQCPRMGEIPFDSDRKLMSTICIVDGKNYVIVKGAPDILFERCINDTNNAKKANDEMSNEALRVIAVAIKEISEIPVNLDPIEIEDKLNLIGLIGMVDPPRVEAIRSVELCKKAKVRPVMITGDHITTAKAIAKQLGILNEGELAILGEDLEKMSDDELCQNIEKYSVFARVSPVHKVRIVNAWQKKGHIVSMTGDGVNDAPALKTADIGCAMGITGTDVAKGAADMVLMDDNFATIVLAVKEGRGIYKNIKKAIRFLLGGNIGEVLTVFLSVVLNYDVPLIPLQLLWINVVTDTLPAFALGVEKIDDDVMNESPRKKNENLFSKKFVSNIVFEGLLIGAFATLGFAIGTNFDLLTKDANLLTNGRTMAFLVLALSQLLNSINIRSEKSITEIGFFSNKTLTTALSVSILGTLAAVIIPGLNSVFGMANLSFTNWLISFSLSVAIIVIMEIKKIVKKTLTNKKKK